MLLFFKLSRSIDKKTELFISVQDLSNKRDTGYWTYEKSLTTSLFIETDNANQKSMLMRPTF